MNNIIQLKFKALVIKCAKCGVKIGEGHTYGYAFYCEPCQESMKDVESSKDH